jgi:hypothetical protein
MFTVYCKRHASNVLLDSGNIVDVTNSTRGIVVNWECYCGHHGALVRSRRRHTLVA